MSSISYGRFPIAIENTSTAQIDLAFSIDDWKLEIGNWKFRNSLDFLSPLAMIR